MNKSSSGQSYGEPALRWYQGVTPYQWWVFFVGAMAWLFDCMDQRLFTMVRSPALAQLLDLPEKSSVVVDYGTYATAATMIGWAAGGLFFGVVGDRWGRVKTLSVSILVYSLFTGLCGLATDSWVFCLYRFLMGCGIGGAFAASATLIAETMPDHSRSTCLGLFSALSVLGNMLGLAIGSQVFGPTTLYFVGTFGSQGIPGWRLAFFVGALPALLIVLVLRTLRESEQWQQARKTASENLERQLGDLRSMFGDRRWRTNTIVAVCMATAGIVGVWGVAFWSPELINHALTPRGGMASLPAAEAARLQAQIGDVKFWGNLFQDIGGFLGIAFFAPISNRIGRRRTFAGAFIISFLLVAYVFLTLDSAAQAYVMLPIMGFFNLSVMGGFVIYFPEIFPTRFRSTGTAFGYNVARLSAAVVMLASNSIRAAIDKLGSLELLQELQMDPFRVGAVVIASVYGLGLLALIWAPETKGRPLPED
ncbi:MAG TPA: MFS transporter [Phycisphaerae bacterium]|nr:MFS transporter [Phycisphaerae bacterium]